MKIKVSGKELDLQLRVDNSTIEFFEYSKKEISKLIERGERPESLSVMCDSVATDTILTDIGTFVYFRVIISPQFLSVQCRRFTTSVSLVSIAIPLEELFLAGGFDIEHMFNTLIGKGVSDGVLSIP